MNNLDIKDFQSVSTAEKLDNLLMVLSNGLGAKITVDLLIKVLLKEIQPSINKDGEWLIGGVTTGISAAGKTPELRTTENGIEWRYTDEASWRPLVSYDLLKLKFSDLTPEQVNELKLKFSDLTAEEIESLRGGQGIQGVTGKSAYQAAQENGYQGTEEQFGEEQSTIANNSARLTVVENKKADLGSDGYVLPEQINPIQGKQTGYISVENSFSYFTTSTISINSSYSSECLADFTKNTLNEYVVTNILSGKEFNTWILYDHRVDNEGISIRFPTTYSDTPIYIGKAPLYSHVVCSFNDVTKEIKVLINGILRLSSVYPLLDCSKIINLFKTSHLTYNNVMPYHQGRIFNKALSEQEMLALWNNGNPQNYRLIDKSSLVAEYLPEYLSLDNWIDSSANGNDLQVIGSVALTYGYNSSNGTYKGSSLTPLFVSRGAVFNDKTGYYELNGLTDITEAQMITIYNESNNTQSSANSCFALFYRSILVTNFIPITGSFTPWDAAVYNAVNCRAMFRNCTNIKVVNLGERLKANNITYIFLSCNVLEKVLGIIDISENLASLTYIFRSCALLELVNIFGLNKSVSLVDSPLLNRDSILYLINNATNTTVITLTLHPTAVARLTSEDIALASSKNITIA